MFRSLFDRQTTRRAATGTQSHKHQNALRGTRKHQFETLENRQVMAANLSATFYADGILRVEGTAGNDNITLRNEAGKVRIDGINIVTTDRRGTRVDASLAVNTITAIEVRGLEGNDTIKMLEGTGFASIGMTVFGGKGNDTIHGASGRDTLMGGDKLDSEQTGLAAAALDSQFRFYSAGSEFYNYSGMQEKWFFGESNAWFYIKPTGDIIRSGGSSVGKVDPGYYNNLNALLDADSGSTAAGIDRNLNLYNTGNVWLNSGGRNEKWLMSATDNKWYFVLPDGTLYKQTVAGYAQGTEVAKLDVSFWNDVNRLANASVNFADNDTIYGYGGGDALLGGGDVDTLYGGLGSDFMYGGIGNDSLYGNEEPDYIYGNSGIDYIMGGAGNDELYGGEGGDTLHGEAGNDILWGGDDRNLKLYSNDSDYLTGGADNDQIHGGAGVLDMIYGNDGDDTLWGDDGADYLYGGNHNDSLYGGTGIDSLYGEAGNDGLFGGWGDGADYLSGGSGKDRFLRTGEKSGNTILNPDTMADAAYEDAALIFSYGDKAWTDAEIIIADQGLAFLHKATNNTTLLKLAGGQTQFIYRVGYLGADVGGNNDHNGKINITDLGVTQGLDKNIVHELGHNWDSNQYSPGFANLSGWRWHNFSQAPMPSGYAMGIGGYTVQYVLVGYTVIPQYVGWIYNATTPFAREYGKTNPVEDFATSLEGYYAASKGTGNPASNWQTKYNYIANWVNGKKTA